MNKEYITLGRQDLLTKNGSPYVVLKLANEEGTENLSVWDVPKAAGPKQGQLVRFLNIKDNMGKKSASQMDMIVGAMPTEDHPLYSLMPRPTKREEWDQCIKKLLTYCTDAALRDIIAEWGEKLYEKYLPYPAATTVHHAYPGGLVTHTYQMLHLLEGMYPCLPYAIKVERCILAILFHDYGKQCEYNREGEPQELMFLLGHIYISAHTLQAVLEKAGIDRAEVYRIVHCVLAHHGELEYGSPVKPCNQEAIIVNIIDNLSAKTDCANGAGNMEKVFALSTHVVK